MLLRILFIALTFTAFLFIFWRKLREDYIESLVFNSAFYIILGTSLGAFLAIQLFPSSWFWFSLLGALSGLWLSIWRYKLKFFEVLEAFVPSSLITLTLFFFLDFLVRADIFSLALVLNTAFLFCMYYFLSLNYKKFTWYRSGRIGFSGLFTSGLFFLIRTFIALLFSGMISLNGYYDAALSAFFTILSFAALFRLGRRQI